MANSTYLKPVQATRNLSQGIVTATRYELYETFPFGEKIVARYRNYGTPEQQQQTFQYYTDMTDYGYGKVALRIDYSGKWTRYEYDVNGRIIKEISPFGDAESSAPENQCQVVTYDYTKLDNSETADPTNAPRWRTKVTIICGQETAREFRQYFSNRKVSIQATTPGVTFSDASNRITTTYFTEFYDYECDQTIRRDTKIENFDGTSEEMSYQESSYYNEPAGTYVSTLQTTTVSKFLNNSLSREMELKDEFGTILSYRRYDLTGETEILAEGYDQTTDRYGRPVTLTDVDGNVTTYSYYDAQIPDGDYTNAIPFEHRQTIKPDGSVLLEAFDEWDNKIFELYDEIRTLYHYDVYGNVIETIITGRNGGTLVTSTAYNDDSIRLSETDANGNVTTYTSGAGWDAETDTLNNVFKSEYYLDGRLKSVKVNEAVKNYYSYEVINGELVTAEYVSETEWNKSIRDFCGNIRQKNYPDGYIQDFLFDEYGRQSKIQDNCNNKTEHIYNSTTGAIYRQWQNGVLTEYASGNAVDVEEVYSYERQYSYYQEARVLRTEQRIYRNGFKTFEFNSGNTRKTVKSYSGNGRITESVTQDGIETVNIYLNGVLTSAQSPAKGLISYVYDEFNRSIGYDYSENYIAKSIRYTIDSKGNVLTATQSAGNDSRTYSYTYDALDRRVAEMTPEGLSTQYTYDAQGNVLEISGATYPQEYEYDLQSRMTKLTTYRNANTPEVTVWSYDNRGRVNQKTYADNTTEQFSYRGDGSIISATNCRGQVIRCSYDALNHMVAMQGAGIYWEFAYDYRGLLLRACDGKYYQNFGYDAYGRLTSENFSDIDKTEIAYRYDGANRLIGYSFDGEQVNYTYAQNTGFLNGVYYDGWEFQYSRISNSNQLFQTIAKLNGNMVNAAPRTYNNLGDLTAVGDYDYILDSDAKRLCATLPDGKSWAYFFDSLNQVTGGILSNAGTTVSSHAYSYDMIGNRLTANDNGNSKQYTANNLNQYTAINDTALTYDADGNMLSDGQFTYTYDALNQLVSVENATDKQVFIYDFMGRRITTESYSKNGEEWQQVSRRRYVYQNWNVIAEYDNGAKTKSYVWGEDISCSLQGAGGVGGLLLGRSNDDYLPVYDGNGNIIAYKNSEGDVVATYSYDPFGNTIAHTGLDFSYKFSTKPQNELSWLYYYGYRFYNYALGRWINRDPIGEKVGLHLYSFINNNAILQYDKLGLACCNGITFNPKKQCCKNGQIKDLFQICVKVSYAGDPHGGHAWISAKNLNTMDYRTYGRWKAGYGQQTTGSKISHSGVDVDREKYLYEKKITGQRCKNVCDYQPTINAGFRDLINNCSTYASEEYNRLPGENVSSRKWLFFHSPEALQKSINMMNNPLPPVFEPLNIPGSPYIPYDPWSPISSNPFAY